MTGPNTPPPPPGPGRPVERRRSGALTYLAQTAALLLALALLIAQAPAPEPVIRWRAATPAEEQRHTEDVLRWAIQHQQP